jgi:dihydroflavonol-4-reductase
MPSTRVLVTGGTGFVGSHVCRCLLARGHDVRLLVRNVDKARAIFADLEKCGPELVAGDVTELSSARTALAGCTALVHAAATTPLQAGSVEQLYAVNVGGTKNLVGAALDLGIERIVSISSITAIFNPDASKVTAEAALADSKLPYGQSKVESERYLRALQAGGAALAIVYPGGILGPDDPGFSDSCRAIKHRVEQGFRIFDDGGMQYIDVRDLAAFVGSLVIDGGTGRYLTPGVFSTWTQQADIIEAVSGCELKRIPARGWKLRALGRLMDIVRLLKPLESPISAETMRYATLWPCIPNTAELGARGLPLRDPRETFNDTLRWMVRAGHLDADRCPASAAAP